MAPHSGPQAPPAYFPRASMKGSWPDRADIALINRILSNKCARNFRRILAKRARIALPSAGAAISRGRGVLRQCRCIRPCLPSRRSQRPERCSSWHKVGPTQAWRAPEPASCHAPSPSRVLRNSKALRAHARSDRNRSPRLLSQRLRMSRRRRRQRYRHGSRVWSASLHLSPGCERSPGTIRLLASVASHYCR